jgi:mannosyltransferase
VLQRLRITRTQQLALPATLGLVAALLSTLGSWIPSLWGDEAASLMSAERPLGSLFRMLQHVDAVHGTYYLGLHGWIDLFGTSPFAIRLPSAIGAGLCTAAVVVLARRLSSTSTAVVAGIVCAVLPRMTYAGEEARSYAFSAAIAAWLTVILVELLMRTRRPAWLWVAYGTLLAFGCYVFLYVILIAAAHALVLVVRRPGRAVVRRWAISVACAVIAAGPIIVMAYLERSQVGYLTGRTEVTGQSIFVDLWFGAVPFAVLAWGLVIGAGVLVIVRRMRGGRPYPAHPFRPLTLAAVAACWLVVPAVLLIGSSPFIALFTARYLTFLAPAAAILIACAMVRIADAVTPRARLIALIALTAIVVATAAPISVAQRGPYAKNHSDWAQISAVVGAHAAPGDAVAFDESTRPSRRTRLAMRTYPRGFVGLKDVTLKTPFTQSSSWRDAPYRVSQAVELGRFDGVTRVWMIEYATPGHIDTSGLSDLERAGFSVAQRYRDYRSEVILLTR